MATVTYSVKDTQIRVNVGAKDTSASICWIGITTTVDDCYSCSDENSYCQSVVISENTDCTNNKHYSGTFVWNGITINYYITQAPADCPDCSEIGRYCDLIDYYVDPYYVNADTTSVTVHYNYWYTVETKCEITRERKEGSVSVGIDPSSISCDATERKLDVSFTDACGVSHTAKCYVQKPDVCCDDPSEHTCYVINDIVYSPSIVPSSGANVSYYFDYKKIESKNCIEKITYGRYEGVWKIDKCDSDPDKAARRCCRDHIEKKKLSELTSDWGDDKLLCSGKKVGETELSIIQTKNPSYTGDCSNICEQDTGYCVNFSTITTYYKDENDEWIPWGRWNGNGDACTITASSQSLNCSGNVNFGISTDESSWTWLDTSYEFPYFGGSMRVTWEYSAYTVYDDCTTSMTRSYDSCDNCGYIAETIGETCPECESTNISHNRLIWEDVLDILPYEGECYDEVKNQCGVLSIVREDANRCDGGTTIFTFNTNPSEADFEIFTIDYAFKKAPCELVDKDKLPETVAALCDCNKFTIKYKQKKTSCSDECDSCINNTTGHSLETGKTTVTDSFDTACELRLIDKPYWITSVNIGSGTVSYEVESNNGSDREGGVTFQLNGKDCYDTVIISQKGSGEKVDPHDTDPEEECNCKSMFEVYSSAKILPGNGGNKLKIGTYIFADCIDESSVDIGGGDVCEITASTSSLNCSGTANFSVTTSHSSGVKPSWIDNIKFEDGFIYGDVQSNPLVAERSGMLNVSHKVDGVTCDPPKNIEIKQSGGDGDVTLTVNGENCPNKELTITPNINV